jgi:TetR/AcrR family transcriptional regulator, lmrAB and yxaGH operons repressor
MVRTTAKLLQRQGYHGTGLNQIVAESDSPKGSIYFHFPGGKEQLASEALDLSGRVVADQLTAHGAGTTVGTLDAYLRTVTERLERSEFRDGCPIATVALEVAPSSPALSAACSASFDRLIGLIAELLVADGFPEDDAQHRATLIYAVIQGALVLAKGRRSVVPLEELRRGLPPFVGEPPRRPSPRSRASAGAAAAAAAPPRS